MKVSMGMNISQIYIDSNIFLVCFHYQKCSFHCAKWIDSLTCQMMKSSLCRTRWQITILNKIIGCIFFNDEPKMLRKILIFFLSVSNVTTKMMKKCISMTRWIISSLRFLILVTNLVTVICQKYSNHSIKINWT